jgi:flagellar biosynthetic protein FlhB
VISLADEKTEKATPKRREDERKKGNIFQSRDISVAFSLLVMFVSLKILGQYIYRFLQQTMTLFLSASGKLKTLDSDQLTSLFIDVMCRILILTLPLLLISAIVAILFSGIQTRFIFSTQKIAFKFNNLNPLNWFKRTLSLRSAIQLI